MIVNVCIKCNKPTQKIYNQPNTNDIIYLCDTCYNSYETDCKEWMEYRHCIDNIQKEFGKFMKLSDIASTTNKNKIPLKARQQSILLRNLLFEYRKVSLKHEKFIKSQNLL